MNPTRRDAVRAALFAAFLPALLGATPATRRALLFEAHRRAVDEGRPLLIWVVGDDHWGLGETFGAVLNHGGDEVHALLALVEGTCAEPVAITELTGAAVPPGTAYVLVETDRVPALVRTAAHPPSTPLPADPWNEEWMRGEDARVDRGIRAHRDLLRELVLPDRGALDRYAAQARAAAPLAAEVVRELGPEAPAEELTRAAAVLALRASDREVDAAAAMRALAAVGVERFLRRAIPGSRWARGGGCGIYVEGLPEDRQVVMGCGMGFVAEKARRMLWFSDQDW